jgi:hypothetical protein
VEVKSCEPYAAGSPLWKSGALGKIIIAANGVNNEEDSDYRND